MHQLYKKKLQPQLQRLVAEPGKSFIEHWNGIQWSAVSSPLVNGSLYAVTVLSANNIWAVGRTDGTGTLIEHWNGTQWSVVPSSNLNFSVSILNSITALSANDMWAVGQSTLGTLTIHRDGGSLYSVATFRTQANFGQ